MSEHVWRQGHGIDPLREWMRRELPNASDGIVIIDADCAVRRYGPNYGLDSDGDLMLIEKKEARGVLTHGEDRLYRWIDKAIASGEYKSRWRGNHILHIEYRQPCPVCLSCWQPIQDADTAYQRFSTADIRLDGKDISLEEFKCYLIGKLA